MDSGPPFLRGIRTLPSADFDAFPWTIPSLRDGLNLELASPVTFLVGENGSGKSTVLEAIAVLAGFNPAGGNRNHSYSRRETESSLEAGLRLSWRRKTADGFFLRAESFFNFSSYLEDLAEYFGSVVYGAYGGKSLHHRSHGESFLALFQTKFWEGLFLLDEPEAALSPARQLTFLKRLNTLVRAGDSQFIIATHSPILLAYPGAQILTLGNDGIVETAYRDTEHYQLTRAFLTSPEQFFLEMFDDS